MSDQQLKDIADRIERIELMLVKIIQILEVNNNRSTIPTPWRWGKEYRDRNWGYSSSSSFDSDKSDEEL